MYFGARGNCILRSSSSTSGGAPVIKREQEGRATHDRATLLKKWIKFKPTLPLSFHLWPTVIIIASSFVPPRHFYRPFFPSSTSFFFFFQFSNKARKNLSNGPSSTWQRANGKERRGWTRAHAGKMKTNQAETSLPGNNRRPLPPTRALPTWPLRDRVLFLRGTDFYARSTRITGCSEKKELGCSCENVLWRWMFGDRMKGMIDGSIGPRLENFDVSSEVAVNVNFVNGRMNYGQMNSNGIY